MQVEPTAVQVPKRGLPISIVTGFLGSGKTTLLNQILQGNHGWKIGVLVNELGEIDIDSQLLDTLDEGMVQLSNGCICCSINEDLVAAVFKMLTSEEKIDYLVIETSGVADPVPIMATLANSDLRGLTRLDAVIGVVDALHFDPELYGSEAVKNQLIYSDVLLVNKIDLVKQEQLACVRTELNNLQPHALVMETINCAIPLTLLVDVATTRPEIVTESQRLGAHLVDDHWMSIAFTFDRPFLISRFQEFVKTLPANVWRSKGVLWFAESDQRHVFQLCGRRYSITNDRWRGAPQTQLVLIGRFLDQKAIELGLNSCLKEID